MATLRDVAAEAGVTKMTASNAINGHRHRMSDATYERVMEAARKLGYTRNASARSLTRKRSNIVSLGYLPYLQGGSTLALSDHDSVFLGELEAQVTAAGRYLMVHAVTDVRSTAVSLKSWSVDGAIFLSTLGDEVEVLRTAHDVPMVFVDNYAESPLISNVRIDDRRGGYLAGQCLVRAGHRSLAFVGPTMGAAGVVRERYRGFTAALAEAGIAIDPAHVFDCPAELQPARELAARLGSQGPQPFTGIFATADIIAAGLIKGLRAEGVDLPRDMSIIGFDDMEICELMTPELTTVRQDVRGKARAAAAMLFRQLADGATATPDHVFMDVSLVERESVSAPRRAGARRTR